MNYKMVLKVALVGLPTYILMALMGDVILLALTGDKHPWVSYLAGGATGIIIVAVFLPPKSIDAPRW